MTIGLLTVAATTAADIPPFKITIKRDNDRVEVKTDKDKAILAIRSPFGISNAAIERTGEKWPKAVVLRLYLKGLESFQASNGKVKLEASVSSQDVKVRLWKDHKEDAPLDVRSPYWIEIRMVGDDGKPTQAIPLKDGYFEMQLPKAFFDGNPTTIMLSWIDFYRN
jgi:hypothetical protein